MKTIALIKSEISFHFKGWAFFLSKEIIEGHLKLLESMIDMTKDICGKMQVNYVCVTVIKEFKFELSLVYKAFL